MPKRRLFRGGATSDWWSKTKDFLRRSKILSTIGSTLSPFDTSGTTGVLSGLARSQGYGRRRMRRGGALKPVGYRKGGSIAPLGSGRSRSVGLVRVKKQGRMSSRLAGSTLPPRLPMKF